LHPKHFDKDIRDKIKTKLKEKVEGKATGRFGYTILVTHLISIGKGVLDDSTGYAHYPVQYYALVFRPFKGEILAAKVKTISKQGMFAEAGPLEIFVSKTQMPEDLRFDDSTGLNCYFSEEDRIEVGSLIRVKLIGLRFASDDINVIGTIREDYLGLLE